MSKRCLTCEHRHTSKGEVYGESGELVMRRFENYAYHHCNMCIYNDRCGSHTGHRIQNNYNFSELEEAINLWDDDAPTHLTSGVGGVAVVVNNVDNSVNIKDSVINKSKISGDIE